EAIISVFDNSLQYAEGLFEMLLAVDDRPIFPRDHLRRLQRGSRVIGLELPVTPAQLERWMVKTLRAHPARIKKLRLTITAGESARWFGRPGRPQVILSAGPHRMPTVPFRLWVSDFRVDQNSILHRIKTLSYALHAAAFRQAHRRRCDDALLLNERDEVAEVTSANIFWVDRGTIYTPPLSSGCLDGVTRRIVLRECRRLKLPVAERPAFLRDLCAADEVFISSSTKLVIGVGGISGPGGGCTIPQGPVTGQLFRHFRKLVGLD
ncbi:MAG TPA: aminotransferase class IV, partial [candidate division Zixibacteria bacterium]|nr:aminotransferase class IV [candidate division Zixibacteria bacterium]